MKSKVLALFFVALGIAAFSQEYSPSGLGTEALNGQRAITDECTECSPDALFSNEPLPFDYAATSDDQSVYTAYDNFSGVSSPIMEVTFWGFELHYGSPCIWFCDCTPVNPKTFEIKFYQDNAGSVGAEVASFTVTPAKEFCQTIAIYDGSCSLYKYSTPLSSAVSLATGWMSVRAVGATDDCWFLWGGCNADDSYSYQSPSGARAEDRAFCLGMGEEIPVSNWALIIGGVLIAALVFARYRRIF